MNKPPTSVLPSLHLGASFARLQKPTLPAHLLWTPHISGFLRSTEKTTQQEPLSLSRTRALNHRDLRTASRRPRPSSSSSVISVPLATKLRSRPPSCRRRVRGSHWLTGGGQRAVSHTIHHTPPPPLLLGLGSCEKCKDEQNSSIHSEPTECCQPKHQL